MTTYLQEYRLSAIDDFQLSLDDIHVKPFLEQFVQRFVQIRVMLDSVWRTGHSAEATDEQIQFLQKRVEKAKKQFTEKQVLGYPEGVCFPATKIIFAFVKHFEYDDALSVFQHLKELDRLGGVFKMIWGEVRGVYFQTALQIGRWYFDVLNDAVIVTNPKVIYAPLNNCDYSEVDSLKKFIEISRVYHQSEVYLNNIFPQLFHRFPFFQFFESINEWHFCNDLYIANLIALSKGDVLIDCIKNYDAIELAPKPFTDALLSKIAPIKDRYVNSALLTCEQLSKEDMLAIVATKATEEPSLDFTEELKAIKYLQFFMKGL